MGTRKALVRWEGRGEVRERRLHDKGKGPEAQQDCSFAYRQSGHSLSKVL